MEAYPGDPYAYMPAGGGRRFHNIEGILPLILLIVIAFFVLQFLHLIPCIIPVGCGGEANVLVVGIPSNELDSTLGGSEALHRGIYYRRNIAPGDVINVDILKNFNVVILQGDSRCDMNVRNAINEYVNTGGKLIVVGNACANHPTYPNVAGWSWPSGQGIPVPAEMIGEWQGYVDVSYGAELMQVAINHPILQGIKLRPTLTSVSQVFEVIPNGNIIASIKTSEGSKPAIIEGNSGFGTVMYFSYDPGKTPEILLPTITYLAGI